MKKILFKALSIVFLMTFSIWLNAATVVIVNSANSDSEISKKIAKKIFLGKATSTGSVEVIPVDQDEGTGVRDSFYKAATNKSADKMKSYWAKMIFSGKAVPPDVVGDNAAVIAWVAKHKDAIGYVDSAAVNSSVKVILTLP